MYTSVYVYSQLYFELYLVHAMHFICFGFFFLSYLKMLNFCLSWKHVRVCGCKCKCTACMYSRFVESQRRNKFEYRVYVNVFVYIHIGSHQVHIPIRLEW